MFDLASLGVRKDECRKKRRWSPNFSGLFGRDGFMAAPPLRTILRCTLELIRRFNAAEVNDPRDAEPAKVPHQLHPDGALVGTSSAVSDG